MEDRIVKASHCGEVRIEAKIVNNEKVIFCLYYLNHWIPQFDLDDQPLNSFSLAGINAYFVNIRRKLRLFLDEHVPFETPKILRELREDLSKI